MYTWYFLTQLHRRKGQPICYHSYLMYCVRLWGIERNGYWYITPVAIQYIASVWGKENSGVLWFDYRQITNRNWIIVANNQICRQYLSVDLICMKVLETYFYNRNSSNMPVWKSPKGIFFWAIKFLEATWGTFWSHFIKIWARVVFQYVHTEIDASIQFGEI